MTVNKPEASDAWDSAIASSGCAVEYEAFGECLNEHDRSFKVCATGGVRWFTLFTSAAMIRFKQCMDARQNGATRP
jgi:hypothetical protein